MGKARAMTGMLPQLAGVLTLLIALFGGSSLRAEDEIRVVLVEGASEVRVQGDGLALFDARDGRRLWAFRGRGALRVTAESGARLAATGVGKTAKRRYADASGFYVEASGPVEVGDAPYPGRIQLLLSDARRVTVVNRLPLETYLLGTVGSEMPASWPLEALKAQSVAARTYALQRLMMARAANRSADMGATVLSQVYRGSKSIHPRVRAAIEATRGEVLGFDRQLVEALFHSTCGGHTVSSQAYFGGKLPYLVGKKCEWCRHSPTYRWRHQAPISEVEALLRRRKLTQPRLRELSRSDVRGPLRLVDGRGRHDLDPKALRRALGGDVRSERFTAETKNGRIHLEGRGFGHGVGLCQWGAKGMAEEGRNYREILEYYYSGARVQRVY